MNVWNKVFLGLIFVASIAVLVFGAVEFHVRYTGQRHIVELTKRTAETESRIAIIQNGSAGTLSFDQLRGALRERYLERGQAWSNSIVHGMTEEVLPPALPQVTAQIIITEPLVANEAGVFSQVAPPDTLRGVVYVFSEGNTSAADRASLGAFLGRFQVSAAPTPTKFRDDTGNEIDGWRVNLVTNDPISDTEIEKIFNQSRQRWSVFVSPPIDRVAGIFNELSEEEKQIIPAEFREKFQPRPMPALQSADIENVSNALLARWEAIRETMDDPESEFADDFASLLTWLYQRRSDALREMVNLRIDIETYEAAVERARAESQTLAAREIPLEEKRLAAMNVQRDAVRSVLEQYGAEVDRLMLVQEKLQILSKVFLEGIAEAQIQAAEKIEENVRRADREAETSR